MPQRKLLAVLTAKRIPYGSVIVRFDGKVRGPSDRPLSVKHKVMHLFQSAQCCGLTGPIAGD